MELHHQAAAAGGTVAIIVRSVLSFEADTAEIKLTWDVGGAHWKLKGQTVSFDLNDWDGKLEGTLASDDELDLTFKWRTADLIPHFAKCGMAKKK